MLPVILVTSLFTLGSDYRTAYQQFLLAKNQFQQYKTESTRLTAITATRRVLLARNNLQLTYLQSLGFNLENEIIALDKFNSDFSQFTSLTQARQLSKAWESRLNNSDQLIDAARQQILSQRLDRLTSRLQPFVDQASPSSTLDLVQQKLGVPATDLKQRHQLLLEAANLLLQLP